MKTEEKRLQDVEDEQYEEYCEGMELEEIADRLAVGEVVTILPNSGMAKRIIAAVEGE